MPLQLELELRSVQLLLVELVPVALPSLLPVPQLVFELAVRRTALADDASFLAVRRNISLAISTCHGYSLFAMLLSCYRQKIH